MSFRRVAYQPCTSAWVPRLPLIDPSTKPWRADPAPGPIHPGPWILSMAAESHCQPTYTRTINHSQLSRVSAKRNLASFGSGMCVGVPERPIIFAIVPVPISVSLPVAWSQPNWAILERRDGSCSELIWCPAWRPDPGVSVRRRTEATPLPESTGSVHLTRVKAEQVSLPRMVPDTPLSSYPRKPPHWQGGSGHLAPWVAGGGGFAPGGAVWIGIGDQVDVRPDGDSALTTHISLTGLALPQRGTPCPPGPCSTPQAGAAPADPDRAG